MKFAKYLQDEVVPEWRKAYINYKQGKKHLKAIETALDLKEEAAVASAFAQGAVLGDGGIIISTDYPTTGPDAIPPVRVRYDTHASSGTATGTASSVTSPSSQRPDSPDEGQEATTTPIISKRRGHGRNYSAIIIPPVSSLALPTGQGRSEDGRESMVLEEDRSGLGGTTLYEGNTDAGIPLKGGSPLGTDSNKSSATTTRGFQFGLTARTQSSQILKNISRRFTIIHPNEFPVRSRSIQVEDGSIESVLPRLLPEEQVFFHFLDSQLEMINSFYREKELEAVTKLKVIKQQLYVASEWKRRYDDKLAKQEAERGWYAAEWSRVTKGFESLMRADTTATEDVVFTPSRVSRQSPGLVAPSETPVYSSDPERGLRRRDLRGLGRGDLLGDDLQRKQAMNTLAYRDELILEEEENRRQHLNHKVARTRIKAALYEFYRSLEMIKNYKVLNHTGFAKILKKFDKTAGWRASKAYMNSKLKPAYFMTSGIIQDLIAETEDVFIDTFEKGHRRRGMAKLRIPDSKNQTHHLTSTRIGLYMGLTAPLMVQALQAAFSTEREAEVPYWDSLLLVYAGLFLSFLFACLFGINMYVWAKSRINYKFIFEFDPRDNLDFHEYFELPIFFMLLLTLAVYLDFGSKLTAHVATAYWPLILMSITFFILFCPLPIAHFTARRWFISSIGRILVSGYYRVEFRDFFLADEMNSLSYSIEQFEFAMCAYAQQWNNLGQTCSTSHMWVTPFFTALPAWFRFLQCLRRYRDTFEWFPHLLNAGKYMTSLINLFVYFSYRHYGGTTLRVCFILVSTVTSIYTFMWDIYMDWGLFRLGKQAQAYPLLRQELVYSRVWVYYLAIVLDFLGRFSWVVRLIPMNVNVTLLSFILALAEVLRRWQWNFFRLENEHLNNCGQFRAIKDIPLPFHIRVEGEDDDDDDDEDGEDEESGHYVHKQDQSEGAFIGEELRDLQDVSEENEDRQDYDRTEIDASLAGYDRLHAGKVRSSSSHSSFAKLTNGLHSHGLAHLGSKSGTGIGGDGSISNNNHSSRVSLHSNNSYASSSKKGHRRPASLAGATSGPGGLGTRRTFSHDHISGPSQDPVRPFGVARSNSFVEAAMAEAGFKDLQKEALATEVLSNNKFYDRRDFDSRIVDADSGLWSSPSATHGLQSMSLGGGGGAGRGGLSQMPGGAPVTDGGTGRGRKASIGTRMRASIFGRARSSDDDEYDDEDTE